MSRGHQSPGRYRITLSCLLACVLMAGPATGAARAYSGDSSGTSGTAGAQAVTYGRAGADMARFSLAYFQAGGKAPTNMPQTSVTVFLPVYPGGRETTRPYPLAFVDLPATDYLLTAEGRFVTGADIGTVEKWTVSHMEAAGYALTGEATVGSLRSGQTSQGLTFTLRADPFVSCDLSLERLRGKITLLQYTVMDVMVPSRPPASLVPVGVQSATIVFTGGPGKRTVARTVTDSADLSALVAQIDSLPMDVWNQSVCSGGGRYANVRLDLAGGQSVQVAVDPDCQTVTIGRYVLQANTKLWRLLGLLVLGRSAGVNRLQQQ